MNLLFCPPSGFTCWYPNHQCNGWMRPWGRKPMMGLVTSQEEEYTDSSPTLSLSRVCACVCVCVCVCVMSGQWEGSKRTMKIIFTRKWRCWHPYLGLGPEACLLVLSTGSFAEEIFLILMKSNLSVFPFMNCAFFASSLRIHCQTL